MTFDQDKLIEAAIATGAGPLAVEEGARLVEEWVEQRVCFDQGIVAVECGFLLWVDERTAVVGVQDLLTHEARCNFPEPVRIAIGSTGTVTVGNEWKTTKEATKFWNEDRWLEGIIEGSQIAIYALALKEGTYYEKVLDKDGEVSYREFAPHADVPMIRVRAVSKSNPPAIWPRDENGGLITFDSGRLERTRNALIARGAAVRAMRKAGRTPWALPGIHCTNQFRRVCEYHEDCLVGRELVGEMNTIDPNDPAHDMLRHIPVERMTDDLVVLSASQFQAGNECIEKYRRAQYGGKEESLALDTGSVFHAVVASVYRQIREEQRKK